MSRFTRSLLLALNIISASAIAAPSNLSLDDLYQQGLGKSETYQSSVESLTQATELRSRAKGSLLPTLDVLGTYFRQDENLTSLGRSVSPPTQRNWRLNARQPIFQGGSEYSYLGFTNRNLEAAESGVAAARARYYLELAELYFETLRRELDLERSRNEAKLYDEQVRELRSRVKIGRTRASDLLSVEAAAAQVNARIRTTESELFSFKTRLASLAGIQNEFKLQEKIPSVSGPLRPLPDYIEALPSAPAVRAALQQRDAEEKSIGVARGGHFPSLDLNGNYYFHREGLNAETKWDVLATLTIPIFQGGTQQSQVREAASRFRAAEIQATRALREAQDEVKSLHQSAAAAEEELKALQEARDLAERSRQRIAKDFRFGLTNNLDLIQAMKTLQETQTNYDQVRILRLKDRIRLEVAVGALPR